MTKQEIKNIEIASPLNYLDMVSSVAHHILNVSPLQDIKYQFTDTFNHFKNLNDILVCVHNKYLKPIQKIVDRTLKSYHDYKTFETSYRYDEKKPKLKKLISMAQTNAKDILSVVKYRMTVIQNHNNIYFD